MLSSKTNWPSLSYFSFAVPILVGPSGSVAFRSSTAKVICTPVLGSLMEAYTPPTCVFVSSVLLSGTQKGLNTNPELSRRVNNTVVAFIYSEYIRK